MAINEKEYQKKYNIEYWQKNKEKLKIKYQEWKEKNREYYKKYHHEYNQKAYREHKEYFDKKSKLWTKNNPEKYKKIVKKCREKHIERVLNYERKYNETINGKYRTTKYSAKSRGYEFYLTLEEFAEIISKPCMYCGDEKKVGIDRIDNSIDYTKENSAPCCPTCNYMKRIMTKEKFLEHIEKIYKFNNSLLGY